jgi:hypothetical protein
MARPPLFMFSRCDAHLHEPVARVCCRLSPAPLLCYLSSNIVEPTLCRGVLVLRHLTESGSSQVGVREAAHGPADALLKEGVR